MVEPFSQRRSQKGTRSPSQSCDDTNSVVRDTAILPKGSAEGQGYAEAVLVSNVKIVAGSLAVSAALFSHFNPWEFPANRNLVLGCVLLYGFCIGCISVAAYIWEANV